MWIVVMLLLAPPAERACVDLGVGASFHGLRVFPDSSPWNQDISAAAVDPNSAALIASIGLDRNLHPDFGAPWEGRPIGIPYVVVDGRQGKVPVRFEYADESDPGPYPIPDNPPIEGGPGADGDRHILVIDRDAWLLYELFAARRDQRGWTAGSGAIFDLSTYSLRPTYWTSADAAGLPIFPGLVRYDEAVEQGEIRHALRFTARRTRRAFVPPARHWASRSEDPNLPPMGMRVRLKSTYAIPANCPAEVRAVLTALQRYGMFLADNGSDWFISGAPDSRWDNERLAWLKRVKGRDLEVVRMEGMITPQSR
ncbi:MAG: hypothetical protein HUU35_01165 [Armatimonadetes bacterium]|nr:hypothetical protein [Armatimonadota bacterium]